ncbi:MAG: M61 family metallopeptidase [Gemmatimonadales bacterium]
MPGPLLIAVWALAAPVLKPQLTYRLRIDPGDLTGVAVELRIRSAPAGLVLAAPAHPEYDDKYWRYVEGLHATDGAGNAVSLTRQDSVLWRLENGAGDLLVRYRVRFPAEPAPRAAWRPFLSRTGGLVGGPHSLLYPVGLERTSTASGVLLASARGPAIRHSRLRRRDSAHR